MFRRKVTAVIAAATLAGSMAFVTGTAAAGNVAWSVSIGGPGFAVNAGGPAYRGGYPGYSLGNYGRAYIPVARPSYRPYYPAPIFYPAPVIYRAPVVYPSPIVYPAHGFGARHVVAAPIWGPPRYAAPYGPY
jgi:hypothetical protein